MKNKDIVENVQAVLKAWHAKELAAEPALFAIGMFVNPPNLTRKQMAEVRPLLKKVSKVKV